MSTLPLTLCADDMAHLLKSIRRVPDEQRDSAWQYIADSLRQISEPSVFDIKRIAHGVVLLFAAPHWRRGLNNE